MQQLPKELQQLKRDNQVLASDLRGSVEALKQEKSVLLAQLAKVTEAEKGHGFVFFYALLSYDNDLLSCYVDITQVAFS